MEGFTELVPKYICKSLKNKEVLK